LNLRAFFSLRRTPAVPRRGRNEHAVTRLFLIGYRALPAQPRLYTSRWLDIALFVAFVFAAPVGTVAGPNMRCDV
jgi:hypothetical protein